jgi:hypothetical protein
MLSRLANLYDEASTLSDAVDWLKGTYLRSLEGRRGAAELLDSVRRLLEDGLLPDGSTVERIDSEGLWLRRAGVSLPLEHFSDGYRAMAALVVDVVRCLYSTYGRLKMPRSGRNALVCPLPGVVLIDEVDAHMHVSWQQKIGTWFTKHFPALQFLVTTHSPFICQAASPRGIIRLPAPGEKRTVEHVDERLFKAIVNGSADDAVMSELFGLEHAHSDKAETLREGLAALELKLITGKATSAERARHGLLKAQLPDDLGEVADRKLRAVRGLRKQS